MSEKKKKPVVTERLPEEPEQARDIVTELPPESPVRVDDGTVEGEKADKTSDDFYDDEERDAMLDEGSLDDYEEGFMEGYESPDLIKCGSCGQDVDLPKAIEWEIDGETHWFCSRDCLEEFEKKKREK